jgi:hypothetical protein
MSYYLGGYFLMTLKPLTFGSRAAKLVYTCSDCINDSLLDVWSYDWTTQKDEHIDEIKRLYTFSAGDITAIRGWVDREGTAGRIGWLNVFTDADTARQYRDIFFKHVPDVKIMSIYFDETETANVLAEFKPANQDIGEIGLYKNLKRKVPEIESAAERFLGFDIIGIEQGGDFHTFHCHDAGAEIAKRFNLELNEDGLFTAIPDPQAVADYASDENTGYEPVPWFVCKTKLVME